MSLTKAFRRKWGCW